MEYKNNWPTYVQGKKSPVKATVVEPSSEVCVGGINVTEVSKLDIALAIAECNKKGKVGGLPLDILMGKLVAMQKSSDLTVACRARKAACELAGIRKTLAFKCSGLKKQGLDTVVMAVENRKALARFKARWASLLEAVR